MLKCTIDDFREYESELWDTYKVAEEEIFKFSEKYIPLSGFLLATLLRRLSKIVTAMLDLCESENYYSLNILYRSFIEHNLKFQYSFMRLCEEKNDNVGKDYYVHCMLYESQLMGKSLIKAQKLAGKFAIAGKLSKEQDKFKLTDIIKYINDKIPAKNSNELPLSLIPIYSRLSSFVHCGVLADIDDLLASETVPEEFTEIPNVSILILGGDFLQAFAAFDGLSQHLKGDTNSTFTQQTQKLSNIYYEIKSKLAVS